MKTVGVLLKNARLAKGYSLEEVETATKIRTKFLQAIEADDFYRLPTTAIARGFVNNYAEFLELNTQTVLAFLRRQLHEAPKASLLPHLVRAPIGRSFFQLTPTKFLLFLIGGLIGIFLLYLGVQYREIRQPPRLVLEAPRDQTVTGEKKLEVIGITDPDVTIMVNSVSVLVRSDGKFYDSVTLEPGVNIITITATSRFGKTTILTREVGYQP